jgi:glycosyltransferase involved in cell wall biosynthesis
MPVAHIIKINRIAGAETHLLDLVSGLHSRQVKAQVIMLHEPDKPMDDYVAAAAARGITVHPLVIRADVDPLVWAGLRRTLRMLKPHIVHTHLQHGDFFGIPAARLAGISLVVTSRHNENAFRRGGPVNAVNRGLWRMVDAGIAISESVARFVQEVEGAPAAKVHVIRYGIPYTPLPMRNLELARIAARAELNLPGTTPVVGMVGRLVAQKGMVDGLRAFAQIKDRFPDARIIIAGDGPQRAELEATARSLGLPAQFLGWRDDIPQLMFAFDVLLVPSLYEGFGLVLLEAMAAALPVVATAVSSVPEIVIHGETGLLAPPRDLSALAEALAALLGDRALRRHLGLLGQDRLEAHFTADRMIDETAALYRDLVDQRLREKQYVANLP